MRSILSRRGTSRAHLSRRTASSAARMANSSSASSVLGVTTLGSPRRGAAHARWSSSPPTSSRAWSPRCRRLAGISSGTSACSPSSGTSKGRRATRRDGASSCPHRRRTRPRTSRRQPAAISSSYLARRTTRRCRANDGHGCWPMCSGRTSKIVPGARGRCAGPRSQRPGPPSRACSPSTDSGRERRRLNT